jgi:hypothetical protein
MKSQFFFRYFLVVLTRHCSRFIHRFIVTVLLRLKFIYTAEEIKLYLKRSEDKLHNKKN